MVASTGRWEPKGIANKIALLFIVGILSGCRSQLRALNAERAVSALHGACPLQTRQFSGVAVVVTITDGKMPATDTIAVSSPSLRTSPPTPGCRTKY
jgi:hypothetical protein